MPLREGYSPEVISENIKKLISEGYSPQQAQAIALQKAEEAREKAKKK